MTVQTSKETLTIADKTQRRAAEPVAQFVEETTLEAIKEAPTTERAPTASPTTGSSEAADSVRHAIDQVAKLVWTATLLPIMSMRYLQRRMF